jgi:hypothetical protein
MMANGESNGNGKRRRQLALDEIEALCANALRDLELLKTTVECVQAEVREARR